MRGEFHAYSFRVLHLADPIADERLDKLIQGRPASTIHMHVVLIGNILLVSADKVQAQAIHFVGKDLSIHISGLENTDKSSFELLINRKRDFLPLSSSGQ